MDQGIEFMTWSQDLHAGPAGVHSASDTLGLSALVNGLHDKTAIEEGHPHSLLGRSIASVANIGGRQPDRQAC